MDVMYSGTDTTAANTQGRFLGSYTFLCVYSQKGPGMMLSERELAGGFTYTAATLLLMPTVKILFNRKRGASVSTGSACRADISLAVCSCTPSGTL